MEESTITFLDLAQTVLEKSEYPLTVDEIWEQAEQLDLVRKLNSVGKTPKNTLASKLYTECIKENSIIYTSGIRPKRFSIKGSKAYNKSADNYDTLNVVNSKHKTDNYNERDLHILLSSYVYESPHFKCHTKTIHHEISNKAPKGKNKWLHPDIVGVYFLFSDYEKDTLDLYSSMEAKKYKLFSFEMKKELYFENLRECYFQAVSNSSWANEGYLVALEICDDIDFQDELKRLNNSFGIGVIKLNPENISQSEILFPARINSDLDVTTINVLVRENDEFKRFVRDIVRDSKRYYENDQKLKGVYDEHYDDDADIYDYCLKKGIITKKTS